MKDQGSVQLLLLAIMNYIDKRKFTHICRKIFKLFTRFSLDKSSLKNLAIGQFQNFVTPAAPFAPAPASCILHAAPCTPSPPPCTLCPLALESCKPANLACRQFACPQAVFDYEKKKNEFLASQI